jgi:hypothetical protein
MMFDARVKVNYSRITLNFWDWGYGWIIRNKTTELQYVQFNVHTKKNYLEQKVN